MWFFKRQFRNPHLSKKEQYKALRKVRLLRERISLIVNTTKLSDDDLDKLAHLNRRLREVENHITYNSPLSENNLKLLRTISKKKFSLPTMKQMEE